MKRQIVNLSSECDKPPRLFDLIINGEDVKLEVKTGESTEVVPWEDVKYQVEAAKKAKR